MGVNLLDSILDSFKGKGKPVLAAVVLFLVGLLLGYYIFMSNTDFVLSNLEKFLGNIIKISEAMENRSKLHVTGFIFQNNIKALLIIMFGGIAFGLISAFGIFFNGFIVGIVMAFTIYQGKSMMFFIAGILPHGILELPVVIAAGAFGLKTGFDLIFPRGKNRIELLRENLNNNVLSLGVFVPLLFIAAAIEVLITPIIIKLFS